MNINSDIKMPIITQLHILKAETFFAYSLSPFPKLLETTEVEPIPKMFPIDINIKNTGVASATAATLRGSPVCPTKNKSAIL